MLSKKYSLNIDFKDKILNKKKDIYVPNIEKAKMYCFKNAIINNKLFVNNGVDLDCIESEQYDVVMSTIALQHICVYDIRFSIFSDIYRILKPGGVFTAQMGYGSPSPNTVDYYANHYDAKGTNRACDVCISSSDQIQSDILKIGFKLNSVKLESYRKLSHTVLQ